MKTGYIIFGIALIVVMVIAVMMINKKKKEQQVEPVEEKPTLLQSLTDIAQNIGGKENQDQLSNKFTGVPKMDMIHSDYSAGLKFRSFDSLNYRNFDNLSYNNCCI
ncbi:MAG: hypothetical protein WCT85_00665 [Parachlamydiales bacterium]|jgi:hypothetical protein